jgi:hypothetical protein
VPVFQGSFFAAAINSTNEANKAGNTGRYAVYIAQMSVVNSFSGFVTTD